MCGRFSFSFEHWDDVMKSFGIDIVTSSFPPRWNIAPSQNIPAIIFDGKSKRFGQLKWGLQPSTWNGGGPKPINTRLNKLQHNPVLRKLLEKKRCIIPASGFYEWLKNTRQPVNILVKSKSLFGMAAIYDTWKSPD